MEEFRQLQAEVFGFSTQTTEFQREMANRLHLPFEILSDAQFQACDSLRLPTFEVKMNQQVERLVKRLTLIIRAGRIEHVLYPVFPPNESAEETLRWMRDNPAD
jgi:peroxiredoxin